MEQYTHYDIGMIGLGIMGGNLAMRLADRGYRVIGHDRNPERVGQLLDRARRELPRPRQPEATTDRGALLGGLRRPRTVLMLVPAGAVVDQVINGLRAALAEGDILIDAGNSHFLDTDRRTDDLRRGGIHFTGMGTSGGAYGARHGPCLMPGGDGGAWKHLRPLLESAAAHYHGEACVDWLGSGSAGHYVKMIHNGIEYGLMQLIAESCDIMRRGLRMTHRAMGRMFWHWSRLPLGGYLTEITSDILEYPDPLGEGYLLDKLSDAASQHGTGSWTVQEGAVLGIPVPVIEAALAIRNLSHDGQLRPVTAQQLSGPDLPHERYIDFTTVLKRALECGMLLTYAQGLHLLRAASDSYRYRIPMASVPRIWRGGCIIRARMLERLLAAYRRDSSLVNPISDRTLDAHLGLLAPALREVVCQATRWGIPVPAFAAAIAYYDAWRTRRLPTDLIQAQRDRFGNHTFNRTDRGGFFHAAWGTTELS